MTVEAPNILSRIHRGKKKRARLTTLYGVHGVGKTTWASKWPEPLFIAFEDGCGDLDVASFTPESLTDAWRLIMEVGTPGQEDYPFKTLVIDSADWMESLVQKQVITQKEKKSMDDFDFGKGYGEAATIFGSILTALSAVRATGIHVVVLAHCEIKKHQRPGVESYDRYCPKLHKATAALLQEWSDEVLFADYQTFVRQEDLGFKKTRGIAVGGNQRILYTQESAGHLAKNRLGLPAEMPFDFEEYSKYLS